MAEAKGENRPAGIGERYDWANTPLGPFELWHPRLHAQVEIVLASAQPMYAAIGKDLIFIHNEAYRTVIAGMPDDAFGRPMRKVFGAIWPELAEMVATRAPSSMSDGPLALPKRVYLALSSASPKPASPSKPNAITFMNSSTAGFTSLWSNWATEWPQ